MSELENAVFALTGEDGEIHRFRLGGIVPVDGAEYVVLLALDATAGSAVLVTQLTQTEEGLAFAMVEDEEIIGQVYMQFASTQNE